MASLGERVTVMAKDKNWQGSDGELSNKKNKQNGALDANQRTGFQTPCA